jgi:hypothetical protein
MGGKPFQQIEDVSIAFAFGIADIPYVPNMTQKTNY